ncbi:MAG: diacylglycerol kinase [Candidatus Paceibacterota bacterium]|jgi:diacylglycerol kinase
MSKLPEKFLRSLKTAIKGIVRVYKSELSFRIQFWFGIIVMTQIFYWPIGEIKRLILFLLIFLIWVLEILNTTFEKLFDEIEKRYHERIGYLKDILAGGVLIMTIGSILIGLLVFWPYIIDVALFSIVESILIIIFLYLAREVKKIIKK